MADDAIVLTVPMEASLTATEKWTAVVSWKRIEPLLWLGAGLVAFAVASSRLAQERTRARRKRQLMVTSERVEAEVTVPSTPYLAEHIARLDDERYICLAIAENKLTGSLVLDWVADYRARQAAVDAEARQDLAAGSHYAENRGSQEVRRALADFMGPRMFGRRVDEHCICVAAGLSAMAKLLFMTITEQGQGVLIPAPYFSGFDRALRGAGLVACPVTAEEPTGAGNIEAAITTTALHRAYRRARWRGVNVRVLLLTSPHNPSGRLYSQRAQQDAVAWARRQGLQVVVDEAYAASVHRPGATFRGIGELLGPGGMGADVHVLYSLSKDFGLAGWRVGVLYSECPEAVAAVGKLCHDCEASGDTLQTVMRMLQDQPFVSGFLAQHRARLRAAYMATCKALEEHGVLYEQAEAGFFLLLDLREFLGEASFQAEEELWLSILNHAGVNLTPGQALHCTMPGWFRLCYAYHLPETVEEAVRRVAEHLRVGRYLPPIAEAGVEAGDAAVDFEDAAADNV